MVTNTDCPKIIATRMRRAERGRSCLVPLSRSQREACEDGVASGLLVNPVRDVYARKKTWDELALQEQVLQCMRALQKRHPSWMFVGSSAALVYELEVPDEQLWPIRVGVPSGSSLGGNAMLIRQAISDENCAIVDHLRVTSLERTTFDCMREFDFANALAVADSALRVSGLTRDELFARMDELRNTSKGGRHAMRVALYADARARDGRESRARAAVVELGFAAPVVNVDGNGALGWKPEHGSRITVAIDDIYAHVGDQKALTAWLDEMGIPHEEAAIPIRRGKPFRPVILNQDS